jgi:uncharacterized protein YegL
MPISQNLDNQIPTIVAVVLDESGSMGSKKNGTLNGYNEYIQELKHNENVFFSLTKFASRGRVTIAVPLTEMQNVPELTNETYSPDGGTALIDATMKTIQSIEKESKNLKLEVEPRFLVVVLTDGEENDSHEFTMEQLKKEIEEKEKTGNWTFVYLGEKLDSWGDSQRLGFSGANTYSILSRSASKGIDTNNLNDVYEYSIGTDMLQNSRVYFSSSTRSVSNFMEQAYSKEGQEKLAELDALKQQMVSSNTNTTTTDETKPENKNK